MPDDQAAKQALPGIVIMKAICGLAAAALIAGCATATPTPVTHQPTASDAHPGPPLTRTQRSCSGALHLMISGSDPNQLNTQDEWFQFFLPPVYEQGRTSAIGTHGLLVATKQDCSLTFPTGTGRYGLVHWSPNTPPSVTAPFQSTPTPEQPANVTISWNGTLLPDGKPIPTSPP